MKDYLFFSCTSFHSYRNVAYHRMRITHTSNRGKNAFNTTFAAYKGTTM